MRRTGFTLVEVLVVIAIILTLAGILFPVFNLVKNRSNHSVCADNLRQLGSAEHLYANDHDGWVPPATTAEWWYPKKVPIDPAALRASPEVLRNALDPYVKSDAVWFCPTDPHAHQDVLWLGMRHLVTSYDFYPITDDERGAWPPRMQLMRDRLSNSPPEAEDVPLITDACGIPDMDSDPQFQTHDRQAYSNHPDRWVNAIRHDISLVRKPANWWMGVQN